LTGSPTNTPVTPGRSRTALVRFQTGSYLRANTHGYACSAIRWLLDEMRPDLGRPWPTRSSGQGPKT